MEALLAGAGRGEMDRFPAETLRRTLVRASRTVSPNPPSLSLELRPFRRYQFRRALVHSLRPSLPPLFLSPIVPRSFRGKPRETWNVAEQRSDLEELLLGNFFEDYSSPGLRSHASCHRSSSDASRPVYINKYREES